VIGSVLALVQSRAGLLALAVLAILGLTVMLWDRIESGAESRVVAVQAEEANRARREAERAASGAERDGAAERLRTGGF